MLSPITIIIEILYYYLPSYKRLHPSKQSRFFFQNSTNTFCSIVAPMYPTITPIQMVLLLTYTIHRRRILCNWQIHFYTVNTSIENLPISIPILGTSEICTEEMLLREVGPEVMHHTFLSGNSWGPCSIFIQLCRDSTLGYGKYKNYSHSTASEA